MYSIKQKSKIEHALAYAARGWSVFPCHTLENGVCSCGNKDCGRNTAKHPLTESGVKDATADTETLKRYFGGAYDAANIAVATGETSGVWVLDVDDMNALAALERVHGPLPKTPLVQTGSGGRHYYFRYTEACSDMKNAVKFAGCLDVRTTGGYVLLPPSLHASGNTYRWLVSPDDTPIADAPAWLVDLVPKRTLTLAETSTDARVKKYLDATPPAKSGDGGHAHTFTVVCRLLEAFPELRERDDDALLTLLEAWNVRCEPPWTEKELRHKIDDARKRTTPAPTPTPALESPVIADNVDAASDNADVDVEWPALDADALYGYAGDFLRAVELYTESDPVALLLTFLNAFGNVVGRSAYYRVGGDRHYGNLFACLVGSSSRARKGTSLGYVLDVFAGVDAAWSERRVSGLSSGEGVINAVRDADINANDGTFTASGGVSDKRLWIIESEFGSVLKVLKRDGNTLSAVLRNAWDRGELSVLTRREPLRASNVHASILGHITQDELRRYLDATDVFNGFANRFLWACVRRSKLLPNASAPTLDALRQRLAGITQQAKTIGEMRRSPSADALWRDVYSSLVSEKRGLWDAATSRAEAQTLRLSMLYALLDGSSTIDEPHLRAALAVWRYCDESARLIFTPADDGGTETALEAKIRRVVRQRPGIMRTELRDAISHKLKAAELERALTWLSGRGEIERRPSVENGRTCERLFPVDRGSVALGRPASTSTPNATALTPHCPDAPNTETGNGDGQTLALSADAFVEGLATTPTPALTPNAPAPTPPATLTELLEWKNVNGATFARRPDGLVWVTSEDRLTPSLSAAIHAYQDTLAAFCPFA
jgi:hypothetical protein